MGVIYIGDRATGKTSLALELANPSSQYVTVTHPDYENLKALLYDETTGQTRATDAVQAIYDRALEIQVQLPTGKKEILLEWLDTPGEIWRTYWQRVDENQLEWQKFLNSIVESEGILLVVPPYREIVSGANREDYITQQQWCNRFERWVKFFRQDCSKVRHLVLCLNKADLFCDVNKEASRLAYIPNRSPMTWQKRNAYVMQRYFAPVQKQIEQLNQNISGLAVRCFITSIHNRHLLELPWIYLGSFLAN
ncbi:MAG: hypothetical protein J7647_21305 [Cyanobacteria bacterium SBLK]|nr:hypothetical protein [Cyanobacteria bacterium SBLK]